MKSIKITLISTLIVFIPYALFNLGIVFEVAKMQPIGFIDVPYSIALSGHRVDIATVFDKEDVEASNWFADYINTSGESYKVFGDTHVARLLSEYLGWFVLKGLKGELYVVGNIRTFEYLREEDSGYIFLSKRNLETGEIAQQAEYASRRTIAIGDCVILQSKIENGNIIFNNGAEIIRIIK